MRINCRDTSVQGSLKATPVFSSASGMMVHKGDGPMTSMKPTMTYSARNGLNGLGMLALPALMLAITITMREPVQLGKLELDQTTAERLQLAVQKPFRPGNPTISHPHCPFRAAPHHHKHHHQNLHKLLSSIRTVRNRLMVLYKEVS
jgi:hypothetical protein